MEFDDINISEKNSKNVRDLIIDTAARLFAEQGVHAAS